MEDTQLENTALMVCQACLLMCTPLTTACRLSSTLTALVLARGLKLNIHHFLKFFLGQEVLGLSVLRTIRVLLRLSLPHPELLALHNGLVITQLCGTVIGGLMLMLEKKLKLLLWTLSWSMIMGVIRTN